MEEKKNADKKTDGYAGMPFDTNDFIREVSLAGGKRDVHKTVQSEMPADLQESIEEKPAKRKRIQIPDYERLFLSRNELRDRQGLYIGRENYEVLQTLVRSIRMERLSVSGLVDNIVSHHIELYGDEINRIYDENSRKPVKNSK
jgi:hypothetical protein